MEKCKCELECKGICWVNAGGSYEAWDIISKYCNGSKKNMELIDKALHEYIGEENRIKLCEELKIKGKEREFLIEEGLQP